MSSEQRGFAIGCYVVLTYLLYWPVLYAARAGAEWRDIPVDWGQPESWAAAWALAPVFMPILLFVAALYWIGDPIIDFIARMFW